MPTLDLQSAHHRRLLELLAEHASEAEVWAYGSRVNGQAHDGSDLDLVVRNRDAPDQPFQRLYLLRDALEESALPILVEVLDWAELPDAMRREVERSHIVLRSPAEVSRLAN